MQRCLLCCNGQLGHHIPGKILVCRFPFVGGWIQEDVPFKRPEHLRFCQAGGCFYEAYVDLAGIVQASCQRFKGIIR